MYSASPGDHRPQSPCVSFKSTISTTSKLKRQLTRFNPQKIFSFPSKSSLSSPISNDAVASPRFSSQSDDPASTASSDVMQNDIIGNPMVLHPDCDDEARIFGFTPSTVAGDMASSKSGIHAPKADGATPALVFNFDSDVDSVMALKILTEEITVKIPVKKASRSPEPVSSAYDSSVGEMRLDSLHFDSLLFDPETFSLSDLPVSG